MGDIQENVERIRVLEAERKNCFSKFKNLRKKLTLKQRNSKMKFSC